MKVGIIQIDGKLPNLALMQITQSHENKGDLVEWYKGPMFAHEYGKIYASKIFKFSGIPNLPEGTIIGGTGIDWENKLPGEIAECPPSYSLYPDCRYHLGFSMKGCRFKCKFCVVPQKEGNPWANSSISDLLRNPNGGDKLMLLDNDFFGGPNWKDNLIEIKEIGLKVCFVQGLNIRIITPEQAEMLAGVRYYNSKFNQRYLTFAWDRVYDRRLIMKGIKICNDAGIPCKRMQFFVLIGYNTTPEQDMDRVMTLRDLGCMPFVMPYDKSNHYQKNFTRWVNSRAIFKTVKWEDYKYNRASV